MGDKMKGENTTSRRASQKKQSHQNDSRRSFLSKATGSGLVIGLDTLAVTGTGKYVASAQNNEIPWLHTEENHIKKQNGEEIILRGVCTAGPRRINETASWRGKNTEQVIDLATNTEKGWHSNVINFPIGPAIIGDTSEEYPPPVAFSKSELETYLNEHLDRAVQKCKEEGVYCIIDFHRHRFRPFKSPALDKEVRMFWETVAPRYANESHVIFELYNEPIIPTGQEVKWEKVNWGSRSEYMKRLWSEWRETAQPWVDLIRKHAPRNLVLIGSPLWSTYPQGAVLHEKFKGENLGYTFTIYPGHQPNTVSELDSGIFEAWKEIPVVVTEWGYQPDVDGDHVKGTTKGFGQTMRKWLSNRPIHWTAWCFDPIWAPIMFSQDSERPSRWTLLGGAYQGKFIKDFLRSYETQER